MNLWCNNWEKFVEEVARCYSDGLRDDELADHFTGKQVSWLGERRSIELGQEMEIGIAMDMPEVKIRLMDDSLIVANYIFLDVKSSNQNDWGEISPGQKILFRADLQEAKTTYTEIEVSICSKNPEVILKLGTHNAQFIS